MILTTETVQSIIDGNNERFEQGKKELLDDFKDKRRYNLTIIDNKDNKLYRGLIVTSKDGDQSKILSTKEFKEVQE